jgi:DNA-binding transcriptional MerR regulator
MEYSLEEIVRLSGLSVDTIRYYQTLKLIPAPAHKGRKAVYDDRHRDRLRIIRRASEQGLPLKVTRELLSKHERLASNRELTAAVQEQLAAPCYTSADMAQLLGIPKRLLRLIESRGLADVLDDQDGPLRYSEDDLRIARDALKLLNSGFPLGKLIALAIKHDQAMRKTANAAISLFNKRVRKGRSSANREEAEQAAKLFQEIFPVVTSLVAHHFQRVLVSDALKQLKRGGEEETLVVARRSIGEMWASVRTGQTSSGALSDLFRLTD